MDCYDDNAEAVVYMIFKSGQFGKNSLFVMKRKDAVAFCERPETRGSGWAYCFTTYKTGWRENIKEFRKEDGRFDSLLEEMGIEPIYRGGGTISGNATVEKSSQDESKQLCLF